MGWEDRKYYRDQGRPGGNRLWAMLNGSVHLFTAFGIRVRAHATLVVLIVLVLLFDYSKGYGIQARATAMGMLVVLILLHEFGHCFAARAVGGEASEILLWPLGGLAFPSVPHRPWPNFITSAGGPAVNLVICILCAIGFALCGGGLISLNPFHLPRFDWTTQSSFVYHTGYYLRFMYWLSYIGLLFNLLPVFPLDGGQILQSILWPKMGYIRSMTTACVTGMFGSVGIAILGFWTSEPIWMICIAASCFLTCRNRLVMLKEMGPEFEYGGGGFDYSSSLRPDAPKKRRRVSRWKLRRLRRQAQNEAAEQALIDTILSKVSAHGMHSLNWSERRALKRATERQRRRELELARED